MKSGDLYYTYSKKAVEGDDPHKTKEDATRFSRHEEYEVLTMINSLEYTGDSSVVLRTQKIVEWLIHEHLPADIQGRQKVKDWINDNFDKFKHKYPR